MIHDHPETYRADATPFTSAVAITSIIATWLVGLVAMSALFTTLQSSPLMFLLLPWSVLAALVVATLISHRDWSDGAPVSQTAGGAPTALVSSEDLDEALEQSFPASDPPPVTTGIARVQPAPAPTR